MEKYCGLIISIYCIARKIINLVLLQEISPTVPSCLVLGHYIKRLLIHAGWQSDQVGLTSFKSRVQNWGDPLKGRGNQGHTRSKALQATREKQRNQAESQVVPGPGVVGWRGVMKSHSLYSGGQTQTALVPAGFWCSSSMRKIRMRFTCLVGQYQCSYLFSLLSMQRSASVLETYLQRSYNGAVCLVFKAFLSLFFVYCIAPLILPCSVDLVWAEISLQLEGLVE